MKPVADGDGWIIDSAKFSAADLSDQGGLPEPGELDYALIRLKEPAGEDLEGGQKRGWIEVSMLPPPLEARDICFIVQHPKGEPVKVATGAVASVNANATRVRYDANTERGLLGLTVPRRKARPGCLAPRRRSRRQQAGPLQPGHSHPRDPEADGDGSRGAALLDGMSDRNRHRNPIRSTQLSVD